MPPKFLCWGLTLAASERGCVWRQAFTEVGKVNRRQSCALAPNGGCPHRRSDSDTSLRQDRVGVRGGGGHRRAGPAGPLISGFQSRAVRSRFPLLRPLCLGRSLTPCARLAAVGGGGSSSLQRSPETRPRDAGAGGQLWGHRLQQSQQEAEALRPCPSQRVQVTS